MALFVLRHLFPVAKQLLLFFRFAHDEALVVLQLGKPVAAAAEGRSIFGNVCRTVIQIVQEALSGKYFCPIFTGPHIDMGGVFKIVGGGGEDHSVRSGTQIGDGPAAVFRAQMLQHLDTDHKIKFSRQLFRQRICQGADRAVFPHILAHHGNGVFGDVNSVSLYSSVPQSGHQMSGSTACIQNGPGVKRIDNLLRHVFVESLYLF